MTDPETLAVQAAEDIHAAAVDFVAACEALAPLAETLAYAERRHRAALSVAGMRDHRPPAREHAAEVALHALAPLTPHVSLVTAASAEHARRQLLDTEG
ncbi:MAG: hypothetical protein GX624_04790 [Actinobacteria bacterium]|mgnify:CR=1 FL=1|nr:hypothetical protein [Actinomycetota bacterium]